ncbi:MAG: glycosyltransferase family 4 protein [Reyranella sp.]|nr:glycosyltransferase family 4 protein [Reyranella sp.]
MKILYVLPEYLPHTGGGIVTYYAALLPALVEAGHEVRVLYGSSVVSEAGGGGSKIDGIEVEILDSSLVEKYLPLFSRYQIAPKLQRTLAAAWALWEQAQRYPTPEVVEVTDWGLLFVPWLLRQGPAIVTTLHGSVGQIAHHDPLDGEQLADSLIQLIEVLGLSAIEGVQSYSTSNVQYWERKLGRKVGLVRPVWRPQDVPGAGDERTDRGLVVGRVQHWKGPQVLCEALRLLGDKAPEVDWIGRDVPIHHQGGSTAHYLSQTWPDIWGPKIHHLPGESPARIHGRQRRAGFVVVPSIWDVFNFTCIEAMAAGAPVICSSGVGAGDLIENGVTGYVASPTSGRSLADRIDELRSLSPRRRKEIGDAGAEGIRRALAPEVVLPPRLDAYQALSRRAQASPQVDDWLAHACTPDDVSSSLDSCLNEIPLRKLLKHSLGRVRRRWGS